MLLLLITPLFCIALYMFFYCSFYFPLILLLVMKCLKNESQLTYYFVGGFFFCLSKLSRWVFTHRMVRSRLLRMARCFATYKFNKWFTLPWALPIRVFSLLPTSFQASYHKGSVGIQLLIIKQGEAIYVYVFKTVLCCFPPLSGSPRQWTSSIKIFQHQKHLL